jgi:hypothetical protein
MASLGADFLPREEQKLTLNRNLGDALAKVAEKIFGKHNTAKHMETEWGFDPSTARNARKGVVGAVPVTKAVRAQQDKHGDGWALWDALGELIIGERRDAYEERLYAALIKENDNARSLAEARVERRRALTARTLDGLAVDHRLGSDPAERGPSGPGAEADGHGRRPHRADGRPDR